MVERVNTPHRASSLCCHETNDGRKSKHIHTPSMKAGQLSRHSCNQIPRGRHQRAKAQAGPEHHTRQPAGEGRQRGRGKEPNQRRADNNRSSRSPPKHSEERNNNQKDSEKHQQEHKTTQSHAPRRATHARDNKPTKETESSTNKVSAGHGALDQGKADRKAKRKHGKGACTKHE